MLVEWIQFKNFVDDRNLSIQYIENDKYYFCVAIDGTYKLDCEIDKNASDTTFLDDFETNYKPSSNQKIDIRNDEQKPVVTISYASDSDHYEPRILDFYTSRLDSLYNRKSDGGPISSGTDYGDADLHFYDDSNTELIQGESESDEDFQTRLTANCVKTSLEFMPSYDVKIFGGKAQFKNIPQTPAYFWVIVAPDIPEAYGGSVPFIAGGVNISFFTDGQILEMDGKTASKIAYDPVYNSGKIAMICKHSAGAEIGIQMMFEFYKE